MSIIYYLNSDYSQIKKKFINQSIQFHAIFIRRYSDGSNPLENKIAKYVSYLADVSCAFISDESFIMNLASLLDNQFTKAIKILYMLSCQAIYYYLDIMIEDDKGTGDNDLHITDIEYIHLYELILKHKEVNKEGYYIWV